MDGGSAAEVHVTVRESPVFYGWLAMLGTGVEILTPKSLREDYRVWLEDISSKYTD